MNRLRLFVLLTAIAACGCGGSKYDLAPVTGVVTIDGEPYPGGKVVFYPVASGESIEAGRPSFGIPDDAGRFELSCAEPGDGAIVGEHTVAMFRSERHEEVRPDLKPLRFNRVRFPAGKVTVSPGENTIDIAFTSDEIRRLGSQL